MRRLVLVIMLIAFTAIVASGCAHTDPWTEDDTKWQLLVTGALITDAVTTNRIQDCPRCYEAGPIARHVLGGQPSTEDTMTYFGTLIIANYFIARALPSKWRRRWQVWETSVHTYATLNNCEAGLC